MHKPTRSLLSTKSRTSSGRARSTASFDANSPLPTNPLPLSNIHNRVRKQSNKNNVNIQEDYDPLPSFGDEVRYGSVESPHIYPKTTKNRNVRADNLNKPRQIETHRSQRSEDLNGGLRYGNKAAHVNNVVKDLKNSNSYLNAMRALQGKVKELQKQLEASRGQEEEIERRYQREVNLLTQRFDQERKSLADLENNLKNRLKLLEEELRERERMIDNMNGENERLRNLTQEVQTEKDYEIERLLNDKGKAKSEYRELEERFEERSKVEEELKIKIVQLEFAFSEKENFCKGLTEKLSLQEKEKAEMRTQFEHKLTEVVIKQKQAEEKNKEIEVEGREEAKRRAHKDEETEKELERLRMVIRELEIKEQHSDIRCREKERELVEKAAQILNLREEVESLIQEHEKTKSANDRTHYYAQDMAKINQRLLSSIMEKGKGVVSPEQDVAAAFSQTPRGAFSSVQVPLTTENCLSVDFTARRPGQSMRLGAMGSGEKSRGIMGQTTQAWSLASPGRGENIANIGEAESFYQGPKLTGEDLTGSGNYRGKGPRSGKKENKEAMMEKLQHETVLKEIIEVEKETLECNREYQRLTNDMLGLDRESEEYKGKKRRMDEIAGKLQEKSVKLIELKKKEEEITSRLRFCDWKVCFHPRE